MIDQGWKRLCQAVLEDADWHTGVGLVGDGIRHVEALDTLRIMVSPMPLFLVYVQVDEQTRRTRLRERNNYDNQELNRIDQHETESQVRQVLFSVADLAIDGILPTDFAVERVIQWLTKMQQIDLASLSAKRV